MSRGQQKVLLLVLIAITAVIVIFQLAPIPQDQRYHVFADRRNILGIDNCWDVLSNIPFVLVGIYGLVVLIARRRLSSERSTYRAYALFFTGLALTGMGSAYYHLKPNNARLVWDRLPMTVAFMSFFSAIAGEYISDKAGRYLLAPSLIIGVLSVVYWHLTEEAGNGDLRPYILVQFLPGVLTPVILVMFSSVRVRKKDVFMVLAFYAVAKVCECFDVPIFSLANVVSGHSLKHLVAALGAYWVLRMLDQDRHLSL